MADLGAISFHHTVIHLPSQLHEAVRRISYKTRLSHNAVMVALIIEVLEKIANYSTLSVPPMVENRATIRSSLVQSEGALPNTYPPKGMMWEVRFACKDCTPCPNRAQCIQAKKESRLLGLQAREQYEALQTARQRQTTKEFAQQYAPRAGIEGTHARASAGVGCGNHGILGWSGRIYSISPPRRRSMWYG